jgi:bifunctional enzyme CysN/CysC
MDAQPLRPGASYWLKSGATTVGATVRAPDHAIDMNTLDQLPAATLGLNDIGTVEVFTDRPVPFAPYAASRTLGGFILIDKLTNATVAGGMIDRALRRSANVHWQAVEIDRDTHARQKWQSPKLLWFTGLSGAGKSTIANLVEKRLHALGKHSFLLDGDNIRHGLNRDLGFSDADRVENIRRVGEVARLMTDAGLIVLTAFISPFRAERDMVRGLMPEGEFVEIFVDTPLNVAETRDAKGLYAKARAGQITDFTGISSPYEPPLAPDIHVDTTRISPEDAAEMIVDRVIGMWTPSL